MVLTPIAKHTSSLTPFCYALSLLVAPARRLETDESAVARYEDFLQAPKKRHCLCPVVLAEWRSFQLSLEGRAGGPLPIRIRVTPAERLEQ